MLQIMPSTWVPGLMKLVMRNAICLRLLSPLPIACAPPPLWVFSTGSSVWWIGKAGGWVVVGARLKR